MPDYPAELPIPVLNRPLNHTIRVPGSKSITNRALVLAALAGRNCTLTGALRCEDTEVMIESLRRLGFELNVDWLTDTIHVLENNSGRRIPATTADLNVANSGTSMRFLAAMVSVGKGHYRISGSSRMHQRPIGGLIDALSALGVNPVYERNGGYPPVIIETDGLGGGAVKIMTDTSSQFVSALMMSAPFASGDVVITYDSETVSEPYIDMTQAMMGTWGYHTSQNANRVRIRADGPSVGVLEYHIAPDVTAASYFYAAAAIVGGSITVRGLNWEHLIQGDVRFLDRLSEMGCIVQDCMSDFQVSNDSSGLALRGIDANMAWISDTMMTLAAAACFASSPTIIRGVAHTRHKESDRIAALTTELRKLGVEVEEYPDGLKITPRPMKGCVLETYNDHRLAMSFALIGLKVPGVVIRNPGCVAKTYPDFWKDFEKLYINAS